jgi:thiosulfate/3-mercaptopyruvate sulfurtransferase
MYGANRQDRRSVRLPGPLVDAAWLEEAMLAPGLVVADVRWYPDQSGREAFQAGHIPGAVFVDVDADLASEPVGESGRHPLPTPEDFAQAMERVGIGDDTAVVAYDDAGGSNAARLWWMLTVTGHPAAVLDGGIAAWPRGLEAGPGLEGSRARFTARPWPAERIADASEVNLRRRDPASLVLDARSPERYRGEVEPIDPVAGHIPGAKNAPWLGNVDVDTWRFLPAKVLRERYEALGVDGRRTVVVHCGSGVTSCHLALALEAAGLPAPKLYVGSWSGWIAGLSRPMAKGPEPG